MSIASAGNINQAIDRNKHDVSLLFISKDGRFFVADEVREYDKTDDLTEVFPALGQGKFVSSDGQVIIQPDVLFPVMHGENSEDGAIPALAQLLHIPVVGCDMYASTLCMNKLATKRVLEFIGIKTAPFYIHRSNPSINYNTLVKNLGSPLFVKPTKTGSSVGISKVKNEMEFKKALALAHKYDKTVLIEAAIAGAREIEVAMLGSSNVEASVPGEIIPDREFYDYESKYSDDSTSQAIIPADLPSEVADQIRSIAVRAFKVLGCSGLARIDFLYSSDGQIILNEVNTMPGFTDISMYPKLWEHVGLSQTELIDKLLDLAVN